MRQILIAVLALCWPITTFGQPLVEPKAMPTNMLKTAGTCDLGLLASGELLRSKEMHTLKLNHAYPELEISRREISPGTFVDICSVTRTYTSRFLANPRKETWDEAGPDVQKVTAELASGSSGTFQGKFDSADAMFYPQRETAGIAGFVAVMDGRSARQVVVTLGYSSLPFTLEGYGEQITCDVPGFATVGYRYVLNWRGGLALPGSVAETMCRRDPSGCKREYYSIFQRGKSYEAAIATLDTDEGIREDFRKQFNEPEIAPVVGTPGVSVFRDTWFNTDVMFVVDLKENVIQTFERGRVTEKNGICRPFKSK